MVNRFSSEINAFFYHSHLTSSYLDLGRKGVEMWWVGIGEFVGKKMSKETRASVLFQEVPSAAGQGLALTWRFYQTTKIRNTKDKKRGQEKPQKLVVCCTVFRHLRVSII